MDEGPRGKNPKTRSPRAIDPPEPGFPLRTFFTNHKSFSYLPWLMYKEY